MQSALTLLMLAGAVSPAAASELRFVGRDSENVLHYLDTKSVSRSGKVVAFWAIGVEESALRRRIERLTTASCADHSYRTVESRVDPASTLRRPTWVVRFKGDWKRFEQGSRAEPGTLARAMVDMACGNAAAPAASVFAGRERIDAAFSAPAEGAAVPERSDIVLASKSELPRAAAPLDSTVTAIPASAERHVTWVNLGRSGSGQAIAVEASTMEIAASRPKAWFRLTNPGAPKPEPASFLLQIDCVARTINQMALRKHAPTGAVAEERDLGPDGEGAVKVEPDTAMETAYLSLCSKGRAMAIRSFSERPATADEASASPAIIEPAPEP